MRKFLIGLLVATAAFSLSACSEDDHEDDHDNGRALRILSFEDSDYKGSLETTYWSSLIDNKQYEGELLYGPYDPATWSYGSVDYAWYDRGNTELRHTLCTNWGSTCYSSGGHAVSNYTSTDPAEGSYLTQLAVNATGNGGHNNSRNFCVHNGFRDDSGYSAEQLPRLTFGDGVERVIDHLWIKVTNYQLDFLQKNATQESFLKVTATGYSATGSATGTVEFYLERGGKITKEWSEFSLAQLGKVYEVEFNIVGSANYDNGYGLGAPAYFAYDDVAVIFEEE